MDQSQQHSHAGRHSPTISYKKKNHIHNQKSLKSKTNVEYDEEGLKIKKNPYAHLNTNEMEEELKEEFDNFSGLVDGKIGKDTLQEFFVNNNH